MCNTPRLCYNRFLLTHRTLISILEENHVHVAIKFRKLDSTLQRSAKIICLYMMKLKHMHVTNSAVQGTCRQKNQIHIFASHHANKSVKCITPYTPLLYSKTGVYSGIHFFLCFLKNIDCGYSLEPPR